MKSSIAAQDTQHSQPLLILFVIGFLTLFLELACIRWFSATVIFMHFFSNLILLAAFLGLSIGCLLADSNRAWIVSLPRLLMYGVAGTILFALVYESWAGMRIDLGASRTNEMVFFGSNERAPDVARFAVPLELMAALFYALNATFFIGIGQLLGRYLSTVESRIAAYSANIAGSLAGITVFTCLSWLHSPAFVWFLVCAVAIVFLLRNEGRLGGDTFAYLATLVILVFVTGRSPAPDIEVFWSPYYRITHVKPLQSINVNAMSHQGMAAMRETPPANSLAYLLREDSGGPPFKRVLIIGAGSGNDASAALLQNAEHIDAVEIDPVIRQIGMASHPDKPYSDPRVKIHVQDGRRFLRMADPQSYDLVIYALVDSVVLQSSFNSLRLESFLFTQEAFSDVRRALKPGGVFIVFNSFYRDWVVQRIVDMLEATPGFQSTPIVFDLTMPGPDGPLGARLGFASVVAGDTSAIRDRLSASGSAKYWMPKTLNQRLSGSSGNGFVQPANESEHFTLNVSGKADPNFRGELASDDWPFLYMQDRGLPFRPYMTGLAVIALVSFALLKAANPQRRGGLRPRMFFLGAAFMLMETKAVVQLGLLFGSTWIVSSIVFFAVLTLILAANLFAASRPGNSVFPYYILLLSAIAVQYLLPLEIFLDGSRLWQISSASIVTLAPIFFAGIIFARSFQSSTDPSADMAANIAGSICGALAEHLSMLLGFSGLLCLAAVFYGLSYFDRQSLPERPLTA